MAIPSDAKYSGTQGTCNWYVTKDGKLVIEPRSGSSGYITNGALGFPWSKAFAPSEISQSFTTAEVKTGVTYQQDTSQYALGDSSCLFSECSNLQSVTAPAAFWNSLPTASLMFSGCASLTAITFNGATFANTTGMDSMFNGCSSLSSLDLSSFNTNNVTNMSRMFAYCDMLTTVTFGSNWKVPSDMENIGLAPCENTTNGIYCKTDSDYSSLNASEQSGTWRRMVSRSFNVSAFRTENGVADEDGSDATITLTYAIEGSGSSSTLRVYKKEASESFYPSSPTVERTLTEPSGTVSVTILNIGDSAYDFRVEWVDGSVTSIAFPSVATNIHLVDIDLDGNVTVLGGISCANIKCGQITGQNVATNSYKDYSVTFDSPFSDVPIVVVGFSSASTGVNMGRVSVSAHTVTADGFYARVFNSDTVARSPYIYWIATTSGKQ